MWWRKAKRQRTINPVTDAAARMIAARIITVQAVIVRVLQQLERHFTNVQKTILLMAFCAVSGSYCLYVFGNAILGKEDKTKSKRVMTGHTLPFAKPPPTVLFKDSNGVNHIQRRGADTSDNRSIKIKKQ